eukprot:TRINITY_DN37319_c0_g2_i1.p1 TRINITY_DN37319_c0_g2~~TRINITY_DN37319_c0_g2_i1.p1  ORF type:complete len:905 (-),score=105.55 TRINITY_DN37319_c0_g2_i1:11-2668(-)
MAELMSQGSKKEACTEAAKNDVNGAGSPRSYRYREFGEEHVVNFDEADMVWSGTFESHSSSGHGEYQDRLRAIKLQRTGWSKAAIAQELSRSEKFVARWWKMEARQVPRPLGVHQYLAHGMIDGEQFDRSEMWRGVEVVRGFVKDTSGLYAEIMAGFTKWKQAASETKDFRTASYFLRYDREGKMKMMTMKTHSYERGIVPRLDDVVKSIFKKCGIDDPDHSAGMYWFSDGDACVGSHRHVFWSARVALGAERIMMIDKTPILMREGDLVIIGPQRHGVPQMPDVGEGSVRISVPFKPRSNRADPQQQEASNTVADIHPSSEARVEADGDHEAVQHLVALGFDATVAEHALWMFGGDIEQAANTLLGSEHSPEFASLFSHGEDGVSLNDGWESAEDGAVNHDEALARSLQMQEMHDGASDHVVEEQFKEYERIVDVDDAERSWDGYGDLMHDATRRATLSLDMLGPQTVYSFGVALQTEKIFFERLSRYAISVLYDFRPTDYKDEVRSCQPHFQVRALKSCCRSRGIKYRHVPVGRETAYGVLRHLESDEVQHILVELVWQAKHSGGTVFLGYEEDWRCDHRLATAEKLVQHGHQVLHITLDGSCEKHVLGTPMPEFLIQEEAKLRKVHAQRQAGEVVRKHKSAADRSTEAVARMLATDKVVVDVGAELRDAENQTDLVRAQKRVVRLQMAESKKEAGLSKKALVSVPSQVLRAAEDLRVQLVRKEEQKFEAKRAVESLRASRDDDLGNIAMSSSSSQVPPQAVSDSVCQISSQLAVVRSPRATSLAEDDVDGTPLLAGQSGYKSQVVHSTASLGMPSTSRRVGRWGQRGVTDSGETRPHSEADELPIATDAVEHSGGAVMKPAAQSVACELGRTRQNRWSLRSQ